ncbi:DUF2076 domain-containing protein [Hansschlegelia sp.]|uniref:DUF2076 domain-containing protein n=1 Tax=Hansschlegelia sp. TaxID=2041892 RepID=UPI002BE952AE|nr:DUF2076 domain-containing protein [Hansschlegelia sp.]HVI30028.1 DUF2076 domain-containing protein [Hansschlegelia sp.]
MNAHERSLISGLFDRIRSAEAAYRDPEAEDFIAEQIRRQPHAPYAMAQTLIVQDQSLEAARARVEELERRLRDVEGAERPQASPWGPRAGEAMGAPSSFGSSDYGRRSYEPAQPYGAQGAQGYEAPAARGGGFLSGALQTAAGVAGGALLFEGVRSLFGGGEARASEPSRLADASPGDQDTPTASDAASQEGGWFSGLLDGVGDPQRGGATEEPRPEDADDPISDDDDWI